MANERDDKLHAEGRRALEAIAQLADDFGLPFGTTVEQVATHARYLQQERARLSVAQSGETAMTAAEQPCSGCGKPLLLENAWMYDGCPCNTPDGVNDGNLYRWRLLSKLQQKQARELEALTARSAELPINDAWWDGVRAAMMALHDGIMKTGLKDGPGMMLLGLYDGLLKAVSTPQSASGPLVPLAMVNECFDSKFYQRGRGARLY